MEVASGELWLPVVGYEGYYEVSSLGRVRGVDRRIARSESKGGGSQLMRGRVLKGRPCRKGRLSVNLCRGAGRPKNNLIHRLVMEAFTGPCPIGQEVNHKDTNPQNNRLDNLEYCTHQENQIHAFANGRIIPPHTQGETHPCAKLTEAQVRAMRHRRSGGEGVVPLAKAFSVSPSLVSAICTHRIWKEVA